ncbi:MAG: pyruvate formate lyase family protein, partial [Bacteroidota bacterium]|nr:pyruvate formate lyase family protein [Bacteroidota bacterium]
MNERIQKLREQSLNAINRISAERAILVTEFYKDKAYEGLSVPVRRAKAFEYILKHKTICINEGELIVGERGPAPKATPTYPEICVHSLQDLEILDSRPKVSFKVDDETRKVYEEVIIPFWTGKTNRERIMNSMTEEWKEAYAAGLFTEFQEQRAPGHTVCGNKIFHKGMLDIKKDVELSIQNLDFINDPNAFDKREELKAMAITTDAIIMWAGRHADKLEELAAEEKSEERRKELLNLAEICRYVPAHAPRTFHEALQYYWFVHLGVVTELNPWDSFNPGRLDQHLIPFYTKEIADGTLTHEQAKEILQSFWVKFNNHPSPPKVGVTAQESNTYTDFCLINVGGVKDDGSDASNEVSFLILDVIEEMRLLQPSSMVQLSKKNPDSLIHRTMKIIKTGFGQPSIFNTDAIIQELLRQGKDIVDARRGGASGCVETGAFGTEAYILTGYFNLPKILELTLHDGVDPRTGKQLGLKTGEPESFKTYDELLDAFRKQVNHFIDIKIIGNNTIERVFANNLPVPFLSLIIDDCIANGVDYVAGGARYNSSYIQGVGLGTITDCFSAIKMHVFDEQKKSLKELVQILDANFEGYANFRFDLIYNTPKYGNDDDFADDCLREIFEIYYDAVNGKPNTRGGHHRVNLLPTTCHVYFGSITG